jgi:hypothetical protein
MIPQLPFPVINQQVRRNLDSYRYWRVEYEKAHPAPPIENIRFKHDPDWRNSFFSITCAHEQNHFIWRATSVFLTAALGCGLVLAHGGDLLFVAAVGGAIAMEEAIRRFRF